MSRQESPGMDNILERLANHPWGVRSMSIDDRMALICAAWERFESTQPAYRGPGRLMPMDSGGGYWKLELGEQPAAMQAGESIMPKAVDVQTPTWSSMHELTDDELLAGIEVDEPVVTTTNGVKTTRYPVKRKRLVEPKPWPGFELR